MSQEIEDRIRSVMSAVLAVPAEEIDDDTSTESIESWDSMKHMNMIVGLEEEFDIEFSDDDIVDMNSFSLIVEAVSDKV